MVYENYNKNLDEKVLELVKPGIANFLNVLRMLF